jgi:FAD/FMN-containing dehydrogenase
MGPALGGGFGRFQGLYGLVSDNFVTLNVVLGDGRSLQVSKNSYPDLFWALKGAGHNFAIVTSAELNIYPRKVDTWHYHNYAWTQDKLETIFETLNRIQGNGTTPAKLAVSFGQVSLDPSYSKTEVGQLIPNSAAVTLTTQGDNRLDIRLLRLRLRRRSALSALQRHPRTPKRPR